MIYLAEKKDAFKIAQIHKQEIKKGFLSSLPASFLERLYICIIENDFCVVAKENNEIIGFIAGTANIKKFYSNFYKKYFFYSVFLLLPKIFSLSVAKKIIDNIFYPKKEGDLPEAELLTVAVKKDFQGRGIAPEMLKLFVAEMKSRGAAAFKVIVGEKLATAIKFYENNGFKFLKNISVHGKEISRVYIYKV